MDEFYTLSNILNDLNEFQNSKEIHDSVNNLHFAITKYFLNGQIEELNYEEIERLREIAFVLFDLTMQNSFVEKVGEDIKVIRDLNIYILEQVCKVYYLYIDRNKRVFIEQLFVTVACLVLNDNPSKAYVLYNKYLKNNKEFNSLDSIIYKLIIEFMAGHYSDFYKNYTMFRHSKEISQNVDEDISVLVQVVYNLNIVIEIMKYGNVDKIELVYMNLKEIYRKCINFNMYSNIWILKIVQKVVHKKIERSLWKNLRGYISDKGIKALISNNENLRLELWKHQIEILDKGLLNLDINNIVDMPTSSGKTLIAVMAIIRILEASEKSTCIYVVPTNTLLNQVKRDIEKVLSKLDFSVKVFNSGYDSNMFEEESVFDINTRLIVVTQEKLDSLIRKKEEFIDRCKLFVFDEFHNIESGGRGFIIEAIIAKIKILNIGDNPKLILLSAVLPNVEMISKWIGEDVTSTYSNHICRPASQVKSISYFNATQQGQRGKYEENVNIKSAIYYGITDLRLLNSIDLLRKTTRKDDKYSINNLNCDLAEMYSKLGNVLIYIPNKTWFKSFSEKIIYKEISLTKYEEERLSILADYIANCLSVDHDLVKLLKKGIAYHHRDLPTSVKYIIESAFKEGLIKILAATSTLAQGLNFPITTIIIGGLYQGDTKMLLSEFRNLIGRCGRAMQETEGYIVIPIKGEKNTRSLKKKIKNVKKEYLFSDSVEILSALETLIDSLDKSLEELTEKEKELIRIYNSIIFDLLENGVFEEEEGYDLYVKQLLFSSYNRTEKIKKLKNFTKNMVDNIAKQVDSIPNESKMVLTRSGLCVPSSIKIYELVQEIIESDENNINNENNIKKLLRLFKDISEYSVKENEDFIYDCLNSWINLKNLLTIASEYFNNDLEKTNKFISNVIIYKAAWFFSIVSNVYESIILSEFNGNIISKYINVKNIQDIKNLPGYIKFGVNNRTLIEILNESTIDREFLIKMINIFNLHTKISDIEYFYIWSKTVSIANAHYDKFNISKYECEQWDIFRNVKFNNYESKQFEDILEIDILLEKEISYGLIYENQPINIIMEKDSQGELVASIYTLDNIKVGKIDGKKYSKVLMLYSNRYKWACINKKEKLRVNIYVIL